MISLIWAMTDDHLIGCGDKIPWHIKEDLLYYKEKTAGKTVFMGDTTYFSLKGYYKNKPLPYGKIYVASLDENLVLDDAIIVNDAVSFFAENKEEDLWVVGGAFIYSLALPYADRLYISFVKGQFVGDKYFPTINFDEYKLVWEKESKDVRYTLFERVRL